MSGILCDECGTRFEPTTDAYKCPLCGAENYPDEDDDWPPEIEEWADPWSVRPND